MTKRRGSEKKRFGPGARVEIINPGIVGTVREVGDAPTIMGEYWHVIRTEFGEKEEPGSNLELVPTPQTNPPPPIPYNIQFQEQADRHFARLAIEEAKKSVPEDERVHPRVGVVIVKDGKILASAHRGEIPQCHAEYIALEKKLSNTPVSGATVYTTLEPCTARKHPKVPCATRLTERRVGRVVIGMLDPDDRISGRGQRALRKAGIEIGVFPHDLMSAIEELNRDFIRDRESSVKPLESKQDANHARPTKPRLRVALKHGHPANFLLTYSNDEDSAIFIRETRLFAGKIELTEPIKPDDSVTWKIQPHSSISFGKTIVHHRSPAASLAKLNPNAGIPFDTELTVTVTCEMDGNVFEIPETLYVQVDAANNRVMPLV